MGMDRPGGYCVTLVYPIPLLPSGPGGFFGLQLRSPPDLCSQAVSSLKRREWDSNPRWSYPHTRFPSVLLKPLGHLSRTCDCNIGCTPGNVDNSGTHPERVSRTNSHPFRRAVPAKAGGLQFINMDRLRGLVSQNTPQIGDELPVINLAEFVGILFELCKGLH